MITPDATNNLEARRKRILKWGLIIQIVLTICLVVFWLFTLQRYLSEDLVIALLALTLGLGSIIGVLAYVTDKSKSLLINAGVQVGVILLGCLLANAVSIFRPASNRMWLPAGVGKVLPMLFTAYGVVHVVVPLCVYLWMDGKVVRQAIRGAYQENGAAGIAKRSGMMIVSIVIGAVGLILSILLMTSGLFSGSAVVVGFTPVLPGIVIGLVPLLLAALLIAHLWKRNTK